MRTVRPSTRQNVRTRLVFSLSWTLDSERKAMQHTAHAFDTQCLSCLCSGVSLNEFGDTNERGASKGEVSTREASEYGILVGVKTSRTVAARWHSGSV